MVCPASSPFSQALNTEIMLCHGSRPTQLEAVSMSVGFETLCERPAFTVSDRHGRLCTLPCTCAASSTVAQSLSAELLALPPLLPGHKGCNKGQAAPNFHAIFTCKRQQVKRTVGGVQQQTAQGAKIMGFVFLS
jgi:hypothetical protein